MFVRFRKVKNGGFAPFAAMPGATVRLCRRPWGRICRGRCQMKPTRCRWAIGKDRRLEPYRYKVMLIENRRVAGKMKQELVATLGSIDATWLDSFWSAVGADELARLRVADWKHRSLRARSEFWRGVLARMDKVGDNRLSAEDRKSIRRDIHKVVPWVMEPERKELDDLDAKKEIEGWQNLEEGYASQMESAEESIAVFEHYIKDQQQKKAVVQPVLDVVRGAVKRFEQGASPMHPETIRRLRDLSSTLLQLLAAQVGNKRNKPFS
jgi:hypothetical protein